MLEHRYYYYYYYLETEKRTDHTNIRCDFQPSVCCEPQKHRHTRTSSILTLFAVQFSAFLMFWLLYDSLSSVKTWHTVECGTPHYGSVGLRFVPQLSPNHSHPILFGIIDLGLCFTTIHFITISVTILFVRYTNSFKYQDELQPKERIKWNNAKRFLNDAFQINCLLQWMKYGFTFSPSPSPFFDVW